RVAGTKDPVSAERAAKVCCLLAPGTKEDLAAVVKLSEVALAAGEGHPFRRFFELARGMAAYRAGEHAVALTWLRKSQTDPTRMHREALALALLFQAMAHHELKEQAAAREAFGKAERLLEKDFADLKKSTLGPDWPETLMSVAVYREARGLLR